VAVARVVAVAGGAAPVSALTRDSPALAHPFRDPFDFQAL
jgi:hypothetical protein